MAFAFLNRIFSHKVITDLDGKSDYLVRWSLRVGPVSLKLHKILRADSDRCPHDHPWWFGRIILAGGYEEIHGPDNKVRQILPWRPWAFWRIYWCPKDFRHRITRLHNGKNSWSLVLTGGRERPWGFYTKNGWIEWREFVYSGVGNRVLWCDEQ